MKIHTIMQWLFVSLLCAACANEWNKHYEAASKEMEGISNETLFAYLEGEAEYSGFVALLKETGLAEELNKGNVYTVWAPTNDVMPDLSSYSIEQKRLIARSHINSVALYETKLSDGKRIKMLSGKNFTLTRDGDFFALDAKPIAGGQVCNNGIVYALGGTILPKMNLLDFLVNSGEEYSFFRRELFSRTDTIFDLDNSFPLGFNEEGNQVYDSAFIYDNPILNEAAIGDENRSFTVFLPSNEVIDTAFARHERYLSRPLSAYDSLFYTEWILQAAFFTDRLEPEVLNSAEPNSLFSVTLKEWRTDKQTVNETKEETSNGYIYKTELLYIPRNLIAKSIEFEFSKTYLTDFTPEDRDRFFTTTGPRGADFWTNWAWNGKNYLNYASTTALRPSIDEVFVEEVSLEMILFEKNRFGVYVPASLNPGDYEIWIATRPAGNPTFLVYVNGNEIGELPAGTPQTHDGVLRSAGTVTITPEEASQPITVKLLRYKSSGVLSTVACDGRMVLHSFKIQPMSTEY
ncbi:MAG: fasciclin domain-containing protein [Odoribacteraceae bacterium]|jgi:uncharacterized surface protein with fasciclin (FAS1) repeats|nr:fasciclin domain-containing protein [Odoribacteraceae bacterium]